MDEYKIDDVAKACGLAKRTIRIRYCEELGVFPAPEAGRWRYPDLHPIHLHRHYS